MLLLFMLVMLNHHITACHIKPLCAVAALHSDAYTDYATETAATATADVDTAQLSVRLCVTLVLLNNV
jgi:hypothetical protein